MRLLILLFSLTFLFIGCGRSGTPVHGSSAPDGAAPPAMCNTLSLLGTTALGSAGEDSFSPAIASRGGLLGVTWRNMLKAGSNDMQLRFTTQAPGKKPLATDGIRMGTVRAGPAGTLAGGPMKWGTLIIPVGWGGPGNSSDLIRFSDKGSVLRDMVSVYDVALEYSLAAAPSGSFGVVFTPPSKVGSLMFRLVKPDGTMVGSAQPLLVGDSYHDLWLAARPGGGYLAGWWGKAHMLVRIGAGGLLLGPPVKVADRSGPWAARYVLAGADRVGVAYLQQVGSSGPVDLMFKVVRMDGSDLIPARRIAAGVTFTEAPFALAWSGKRFAVVYDGGRPDLKLTARLLDQDGAMVGGEVAISSCLLTARQPVAAWAGDTLGVAFQARLSGLPTQRACLAALRCK